MLGACQTFILDCIWIVARGVIGFTAIMLMILGGIAIRNTWHDIMRRYEEKMWKN